MNDALSVHRLHFAFTITYHYLFPQLTMGLALIIMIFKTLALRNNDEGYARAARFWARIFAINFGLGVVTGIPMEFQFGTSWARFSERTGGVIGQTLAIEGMYAFFLESSFLGLFLYGEKRLSAKAHWFAGFMLFLGSWLSGFFIICTDAWMQHPVGYTLAPDGKILLNSLSALIFNPWAFWQYLHNMCGSVVTASFVVSGGGALYVLLDKHREDGERFLKIGVTTAAIASVLQVFPTGDGQGKMVARHQPATLAAMEGLFETKAGAPMVLIGQPDVERRRLDNPLEIPRLLSILTYKRWGAEVKGLDAFPQEQRPDNIPLLYYAYHVMVGLGTMFIALMGLSFLALLRGKLFTMRPLLWAIMLATPLPYVANTAGWITAETGRQPWLVYGLLKTAEGSTTNVSAGNALFTLLGFMGLYTLLSILFVILIYREFVQGPPEGGH